ncbi:MAG: radical SAM protein [Bdellovibrionales bacterium]|nr:radical SAM protein [Bdellovibrionales bacterium]
MAELRNAGSLYLILMGGEAMLSPYFWDIALKANDLGFHVSMISNGLKIKDLDTAKKLKDFGIHNITFSVYSLDECIHDGATKIKGSLQRTLEAIEFCDQAEIEVSINSLLRSDNIEKIFEVEDWALKKGYCYKFDPTITPKLNGDTSTLQHRATREQLKNYYKTKVQRWENGKPMPLSLQSDNYVCNAAKGKCAVNPYGELLACVEIRKPLGNLKDVSFEEAWNSAEAKKWREVKNKDIKGLSGKACSDFCDHCPGMAHNEHQDSFKVTNFDQMHAEVKMEVFNEHVPRKT